MPGRFLAAAMAPQAAAAKPEEAAAQHPSAVMVVHFMIFGMGIVMVAVVVVVGAPLAGMATPQHLPAPVAQGARQS